jgi:hypothetical protein
VWTQRQLAAHLSLDLDIGTLFYKALDYGLLVVAHCEEQRSHPLSASVPDAVGKLNRHRGAMRTACARVPAYEVRGGWAAVRVRA